MSAWRFVGIGVALATTALCIESFFRSDGATEPSGGAPTELAASPPTPTALEAAPSIDSSPREAIPGEGALLTIDSAGTLASDGEETAFLSGVVVDAVGRPIPDARVTAITVVEGICPASQYLEWSLADLDPSEGIRGRTDAAGEFVLFGARAGARYALFADLQGEDVWWIDECATPIAQLVAPQDRVRLGLPYGILNVSVRLPADLEAIAREGTALDVRLRIKRGADDERVIGDVREPIRVAVAFGMPVEIAAEGIGLRERTIDGIAVSELVGSVDVPFELESTGLAHRLEVIVMDPEGSPVPDTWVYEVSAFDPPRFETMRTSGCSTREEGVFVFELLEAREHAIVAIPDADTGLAPTGSYVSLPPSAVRELHLPLGPGEFVEVRLPSKGEEVQVVSTTCPDLDFDVGQLVEWVEAGRGSWERVKNFLPGHTYRSTFRLPLGRVHLRFAGSGEERIEKVEIIQGQRSRIDLTAAR